MDSYEALKEAVDKVGAKKVAALMHVSTSLVYKWCEAPKTDGGDDVSGARNPLDRTLALIEATGDTGPLAWICARSGGYFVNDPEIDPSKIDIEYIHHTQQLIDDFSRLLGVMSKSIADDGRIDPKESTAIRKEWQELKAYGECFVRACEEGLFDKIKAEE